MSLSACHSLRIPALDCPLTGTARESHELGFRHVLRLLRAGRAATTGAIAPVADIPAYIKPILRRDSDSEPGSSSSAAPLRRRGRRSRNRAGLAQLAGRLPRLGLGDHPVEPGHELRVGLAPWVAGETPRSSPRAIRASATPARCAMNSQVTSCSASEVAAMIEGLLRHLTDRGDRPEVHRHPRRLRCRVRVRPPARLPAAAPAEEHRLSPPVHACRRAGPGLAATGRRAVGPAH